MIKSGVSKTLQENLALEQQLSSAYTALDAAQDEHTKKYWSADIKRIHARINKLPNYNRKGLEFIQAVLSRAMPQPAQGAA